MAAYIKAGMDGYADTQPTGLNTTDEGAGPIILRLSAMSSISGVVRGSDGTPLAGVDIGLTGYVPWAGWPATSGFDVAKTAADGSYNFTLPAGRYILRASKPRFFQPPERDDKGRSVGYVPVRYPNTSPGDLRSFLEVAEGEKAKVNFQLRREILHHVTGIVTGRESQSNVEAVGPNGFIDFIRTSARCCEFEVWLPNGHFWLSSNFTAPDGQFSGSLPIDVEDNDVTGVVFPVAHPTAVTIPIEISASTTHETSLIRQAGYLQSITLVHADFAGFAAGPQSTMAGWMQDTGAKRAESINLPPGMYSITLNTSANAYAQSISRHGVDLIREPLEVSPDANPEPIRIVIAAGATVEGIARRGGKPTHAFIYAVPEQPDGRLVQFVVSDPDGNFSVNGLAPARYLFFASDAEVQLDVRSAAEIPAHWQRVGRSVMLEAGKTISFDLEVTTP